MLIAAKGRMLCLSKPQGKRGFFYKAWTGPEQDWQRIEITATKVTLFAAEDLEQERRALGEVAYRQEYLCSFEVVQGLVYPELASCIADVAPAFKRKLGGMDFGYRNPFAAIWGGVDSDGVLWITK